MDKSKAEDYKFTIRKAIVMKESGKLTYPMVKEKQPTGMDRITPVSLRIAIDMGRESSLMLKASAI